MAGVNVAAPHLAREEEQDSDLFLPKSRTAADPRTKLQRSYAANGGRIGGVAVVNACPWRGEVDGCGDEALDENGYCKHLIGTTLPGDRSVFNPLVTRPEPLDQYRFTDGTKVLPVQPGDHLEPITAAYCRVYRRSGKVEHPSDKPAEEPKAKKGDKK